MKESRLKDQIKQLHADLADERENSERIRQEAKTQNRSQEVAALKAALREEKARGEKERQKAAEAWKAKAQADEKMKSEILRRKIGVQDGFH